MNERARKRFKVCFLVWLLWQGSAVSETTKLDTHVRMWSPTSNSCKSRNHWVSSHTSNFSTICHSDPEIRRWGTRAHVQRCPTPPMNCVKHVVHGPQLTHQNWTQSAKPFLRYRSAICTCARAEIPNPWLVESTWVMTRSPLTKFEYNRPSRLWDTEARCARAHVQIYPIRDYCISCS